MRSPFRVRAAAAAALATFAALVLAATPAPAQEPTPVGPWDGSNPFNCVNQDVGKGTDFPHPEADPFCVEFDKTSQNVTDFGIGDFLLKEPARTAAAASKCFYFQRDHWTGSIVQGSDPELWHWDGDYFFDRAKGIGGAHVKNLRVGGVPVDVTPYVPPQYAPYTEPTGGGGAIVLLETDPDPSCGAKVDTPAERQQVYRDEPRYRDCIAPGGPIERRRVGAARLGISSTHLRKRLGPPRRRRHGISRWCVNGGSSLHVSFRAPPGGARRAGRGARGAALIRTDNPGLEANGVGVGDRRRRAGRRLALARVLGTGRTTVYEAQRWGRPRRELLLGIRKGRVRWLALADPARVPTAARLRHLLRAGG